MKPVRGWAIIGKRTNTLAKIFTIHKTRPILEGIASETSRVIEVEIREVQKRKAKR